ncbi:hypothetical protein CAP36_02295 [Chitinophagaceae bacterium IBVUCB2]|nr:hypothetical protein CAP36_02295 [Chitinophagaceae bacterium IBVUCB2]
MYAELYKYLLQHYKLPVPGIGTFLLEKTPARLDFSNKMIAAPLYSISLQAVAASPATSFFCWLGNIFHISERDAVLKFNDFVFNIKKQIDNGDTINWNGVGAIAKGLGGEIKFSPYLSSVAYETPVTAKKVIREKAEHTIRVGEDQKTSAQMVEILKQPEVNKSYWWAYALAIGLLSIVFTGWYFSKNGISVSATANNQQLTPSVSNPTYKILP